MAEDRIGDWLNRQLARREWSRADFARQLRVGSGTVSKWFNGHSPSSAYSRRIAEVLGVDPRLVLILAGHLPDEVDVDLNSAEAKLIPLIRRVDWNADPRRLESVERDLRWFIELDQREKQ